MTSEVEVDGRICSVAVERTERGFDVTVDGRRCTADLVPVPSGWSLLIDGRSYEVAVEERRGALTVHVNGGAFAVALPSASRGAGRRKAAVHTGGPQQIVTPMPGRIVRVLVKPGDTVSARQGLIVIEAMKMENELRASGPGTVVEVRVSEGALVEANSVLMVIA